MGHVSQGKLLTAQHPFFAPAIEKKKTMAPQPRAVSDGEGKSAVDTDSDSDLDLAEEETMDDEEGFLGGDEGRSGSEGDEEREGNEPYDLNDRDEGYNSIQS